MNTSESCIIEPLPAFDGERRTYQGIAQPFATHAHDHYVFGIVREGERTLKLNDEVCSIHAGSLIVFNPGDVHGCEQISETLFAYDSLTVSRELLENARFKLPSEEETAPREAFLSVLALLDEAREDEALEALVAFVDTLEQAPELDRALTSPRNEQAAMRLHAHIVGHLAEPLSVSAFATEEGLSPCALIRAYKRAFSITPVQHVLSLRIEAACKLLAKGADIAHTAAELGFSDQAHLTREFKRRLGTTPAAYREMSRASEQNS